MYVDFSALPPHPFRGVGSRIRVYMFYGFEARCGFVYNRSMRMVTYSVLGAFFFVGTVCVFIKADMSYQAEGTTWMTPVKLSML